MLGYLLRRLAWIVLMLLLVSTLTFFVFHVLPAGDPATLRAGRDAPPEVLAQVREELDLNQSVLAQYATFLERLVLHGDLGFSYRDGVSVNESIADALPATVSLAAGAIVLWLALSLLLGTVAAARHRRGADRVIVTGSLVAFVAPVYLVGLTALYLFASDIGRFPVFEGAGSYVPLTEDPATWLGSLLLPWMVLAAPLVGLYTRLLRATLLEAQREPHVRYAHAKGLSQRRVLLRHALRSALVPLLPLLALDLAALLSGAVLVETIFNIPGIGTLALDSIHGADLPMIEGTVLFAALLILVANLVVDLAQMALDPLMRRGPSRPHGRSRAKKTSVCLTGTPIANAAPKPPRTGVSPK